MTMQIARLITNILLLMSLFFNGTLIYFFYSANHKQGSLLNQLLLELSKLKEVLANLAKKRDDELTNLMQVNLKTQTLLETILEEAEKERKK